MKEIVKIILMIIFLVGLFILPVFAQNDEISSNETTDSAENPDGETLSIKYTIREGTVKNILFDQHNFSVLIQIESFDGGTILFNIPRELLDAKMQNGQDENFIVLINNIQVDYKEIETNSDFRFIQTSFQKGDSEIQIIGTHLLGKSFLIPIGGQVTVSSNTSTEGGIFDASTFKIIPDTPNAGGTIRVTGDNFGASQEFKFYINSKKLGSFETGDNNHFMTTFQIPEDQKEGRVTLSIKDNTGDRKEISVIIANNESPVESDREIDNTSLDTESNFDKTVNTLPDPEP